MPKRSYKPVIDRALRFIAEQQEADGRFKSLSSPRPSFSRAISYETIFVPSLILGALSQVDTPQSRRTRKKITRFLLREKSSHWSFNYWASDSPQRKSMPYPDDLDDTFCALIGLYLHDPDLIDKVALVSVVRLLLATETEPGGPYRTWLVSDDSKKIWLDVDLAVNCNIAYFLKLTGNSLPTLQKFMEDNFDAKKLRSPYYPNSYPVLYYLARGYDGSQPDKLQAIVRSFELDAVEMTPLKAALLLASLARLGISEGTKRLAEFLSSGQQPDGSWPPEAFCLDPARDGKTHYNGAATLTTAFAAEALALYGKLNQPAVRPKKQSRTETDIRTREAVKQVEAYYAGLSSGMAAHAQAIIKQLSGGRNGSEIVGLPHEFNKGFSQSVPQLRRQVLDSLGLANLYGWIAYTIYDDFLDEEGKPELLPVANAGMRQSLQYFANAVPACPPFEQFVYQTFDVIDTANVWELDNCRCQVVGGEIRLTALPKYGCLDKLAEKSLGHALAPLAILCLEGVMPGSADFKQVQKALKHYLIAKQLNDDAHDWQEDISKGRLTWVVCVILQEAGVDPGRYQLDSLLPKLQRQFWHRSLKTVCKEMSARCQASRKALEGSKVMGAPNVLTELLDGVEASIEETLAKQRQARDFLKSYQHSSSVSNN